MNLSPVQSSLQRLDVLIEQLERETTLDPSQLAPASSTVSVRRETLGELRDELGTIRHALAVADAEKQSLEKAQADAVVNSAEVILELEETKLSLELSRRAAESASEAKSRFLANMSHEMRTPLNGILGFADLLRSGAEDDIEERHEFLDIILKNGRHLLNLISEILDVAKVESGDFPVEIFEFKVADVVVPTIELLQVKTRENGNHLTLEIDRSVPAFVRSDPDRLRQIVLNLVGNALKFTKNGRITLRLEQIEQDGAERLALHVIDTGIGIPKDQLEAIFRPFVQADQSVTRLYGGLGLGLTLTKHLVERLGGTLTVVSEERRGSTFTATIDSGVPESFGVPGSPAAAASGHDRSAQWKASDSLPQQPLQKILVVDDGETNRKYVKLVLSRAGFAVHEAGDGQQAVERVRAEPFDLILMDVHMPVLNGHRATSVLRRLGVSIPILALTADVYDTNRQTCLAAGCDDCIAKPIASDVLLTTVKHWLAEAARTSADTRRTSADAVLCD